MRSITMKIEFAYEMDGVDVAYEELVSARGYEAVAADKLARAKYELEEARAKALAGGQVEARNETMREALLRELLAEWYEHLYQAELQLREKRHAAEIAQLEVDRVRLRVRLMELAAGQERVAA